MITNTENANTPAKLTASEYLKRDIIKHQFEQLIGANYLSIYTDMMQLLRNPRMAECSGNSIFGASITAVTMGLSINPNFGRAWIIPYWNAKTQCLEAQFQIGWKGFVELAKRSGYYTRIGVKEIYENQIKERNFITDEIDFNNVEGEGKVVGFYAWFEEINPVFADRPGLIKSLYIPYEKMQKHAMQYSQAMKKDNVPSVWKDGEKGFVDMGNKTTIKMLLNKWGTLSPEMKRAIESDQAVVDVPEDHSKNEETIFRYVDNEPEEENKGAERFLLLLENAKDASLLTQNFNACTPEIQELVREQYNEKMSYLVSIEDSKEQTEMQPIPFSVNPKPNE